MDERHRICFRTDSLDAATKTADRMNMRPIGTTDGL
jgi:hypothetical protein